MKAFGPLRSLTLSTALVAALAVVVIAGTTPAQATPLRVSVHAAPSTAQLRQLAADVQGHYELADGRALQVWREAGRLQAQLGDDPIMRLEADGPGQLRSTDGRHTLRFTAAPDGRAWAVTLQQRR